MPIDKMKNSSLLWWTLSRPKVVTKWHLQAYPQISRVGTGSKGGIIAENHGRKDDRFISRDYCWISSSSSNNSSIEINMDRTKERREGSTTISSDLSTNRRVGRDISLSLISYLANGWQEDDRGWSLPEGFGYPRIEITVFLSIRIREAGKPTPSVVVYYNY